MSLPVKIRIGLLMALTLLAMALPAFASEIAVLRNGFSIRHERHEVFGATTRLYLGAGNSNYVDVPTSEIQDFEHDTVVAAPPPAKPIVPSSSMDIHQAVVNASGEHHLDPDFVNSVIHAESGFNPRAVSRKGAQGLMQLMPQTATNLGVADAFNPQANVEGGTKYLRELLERYNFDLAKALAAYNAGPQRVDHYKGVPPFAETQAYIARIIRDFNRKKLAEQQIAKRQAAARRAALRHGSSVKKDSARLPTVTSSASSASTPTAAAILPATHLVPPQSAEHP